MISIFLSFPNLNLEILFVEKLEIWFWEIIKYVIKLLDVNLHARKLD